MKTLAFRLVYVGVLPIFLVPHSYIPISCLFVCLPTLKQILLSTYGQLGTWQKDIKWSKFGKMCIQTNFFYFFYFHLFIYARLDAKKSFNRRDVFTYEWGKFCILQKALQRRNKIHNKLCYTTIHFRIFCIF